MSMKSKPFKKILVRNCEQKKTEKPKLNVIRDEQQSEDKISRLMKAYDLVEETKLQSRQNDLNKPVLNSALSIARQMSKVKSTKNPPTNTSKSTRTQLNMEKCITKQLNFPSEKHLYKDLVDLNISGSSSSNEYNIRSSAKSGAYPKRKKDPVLKIDDFTEPRNKDFIRPDIPNYNNPPLKPYRIFDMTYTQETMKTSHLL